MAEAVVSCALETLRDLLLEEGRFLSGVSGEVKAMQILLKEVKCLLEDADRRQRESKSVINWIAEIRDLAHRAEDAIETYAFHVSSNKRRGFRHLLTRFSKKGFLLHQIGSEISQIKVEISRVTKSMQKYGIKSIIQGETSTPNQQWERQTFPFEIEDCFVGKEDELKQLVSLVANDKQHRVVSIWGMGGIGKTTIARKVWNHTDTKRSFECFAWVCITQQCQIRSVLEDVLKQLIPQKRDDISSLSNTELIGQLCQIQEAKRCIIVLDDLWEINQWDGLKHAFLVQDSKSKIMLTTRNRKVANMGYAFVVGVLNIDDGLELLKRKAFPQSKIPDFPVEEKMLRKIGEEMVHKCGYLPLALSLLGGLLSTRKSMEEWEAVNENISAYLYQGEGFQQDKEIHGVLTLSYEDLPYYLKPCFLHMGLFKEDEQIPVRMLYWMWIAQGFVSNEKIGTNETLMDVAELYLSELASRCIVQVEVLDAIKGRKYSTCKLHDVVRELCLSEGKKDFGIFCLQYRGGKFSTLLHECYSGHKTRHLAIRFEREVELQGTESIVAHDKDRSKHIKTLDFFNNAHGRIIEFPHAVVDLQKFKLLKNLIFFKFKFSGKKFSSTIGNLIHLRYLCIEACDLKELPSSISNLVYLYALDLLDSWNIRVPNVLQNMSRLRHLILPSYLKEKIENNEIRFDQGLDELETLHGFDSWVHNLKSITRMKNLRSLTGIVRDNESLSEIVSAFTTIWKKLEFCGLVIEHGCYLTLEEEARKNLKKVFTCLNLHRLAINVQMGKLLVECANQITSSKLVYLELFNCEIEDDPMGILGKLPFLEELFLYYKSYVGQEMECDAFGFPRLRHLILRQLPNLKKWRVEQGAMPILSKLDIIECSCLEMIPDGLRFIGTLRCLVISHLGKRISDGGEDFDKIRHIPSIIIL